MSELVHEITVADVLVDLRYRYPDAQAMLFDPVEPRVVEAPLFVSYYFPRLLQADVSPLQLVEPHDHDVLRAAIERSTMLSAAQTPPLSMTDGSTAICSLHRLDELDVTLALFSEPGTMRLRLRDRPPEFLQIIGQVQLQTDGIITKANAGFTKLVAPNPDLTGRNLFDVLNPDFAASLKEAIVEFEHDPTIIVQLEAALMQEAGDEDIRLELSYDAEHDLINLTAARPERKLVDQRQLLRSDQEFRTLAETLPVGVFVLDRLGPLKFANETLHKIYGVPRLSGYEWLDAIHPEDRADVEGMLTRLRLDRLIDIKVRVVTPTGDIRWCRIAARDLRDPSGELDSIVGLVEDITEIRSMQNRLERQASTDALTSLPNRSTLLAHLAATLEAEYLQPGFTAVLFVDLDGFKLINDTQGHSVGDLLLQHVARRFAASLRPGDLIARFGGDEFVVVARNVENDAVAEAVASRLHEALQAPIVVDEQVLTTTASIGIALSHGPRGDADQLLGDADLAMYEAKRLGRRRTVLYDSRLREAASQRFDISTDLRHARERRELRVEYQPIIDLASGKPSGTEALLRWDLPTHGRLMPGSFIEIAEENGMIIEVGDWIIEQACADLARLRYNGLVDDDFFMTVNISTLQLSQLNDLAATAQEALTTYGLRPYDLVFELTESIPVDAIPEAAAQVRQLRDLGFRLAIDDFGTGYSSLEYLTMLPFNLMKIDPTFTSRLTHSESSSAVLESITVMARRLGFDVIAEGIETEEQVQSVIEAGVRFGQGYLHARPQPIGQLMTSLEAKSLGQ